MDVTLPELGENVSEGIISKWHRKVGDTVQAGDVLLEVETDKVSSEIPAPGAGVIAQILLEEGSVAHVGQCIAVLRDDG